MGTKRDEELKDANYELFILALSLLSIFNWFLYFLPIKEEVLEVAIILDLALSLIFVGDFIHRFRSAQSERNCFLKQYGWLNLPGSLPFPHTKIARLGRLFRALRLMRAYGLRNLLHEFVADRAETAVYTVGFLIIFALAFGSMVMLSA